MRETRGEGWIQKRYKGAVLGSQEVLFLAVDLPAYPPWCARESQERGWAQKVP